MVIHPTSVFASDPEVLQVPEGDTGEMGTTYLHILIFYFICCTADVK